MPSKRICRVAASSPLSAAGVERADRNGPPTAFRVWSFGAVEGDFGENVLTPESVARILEEQATRGTKIPIDIEHRSIDKTAPLEAQAAVAFASLEGRADGLWAVAIEWRDDVRGLMSQQPPAWRYHSPVYFVDPASGEIQSIASIALTNAPATFGVTDLAAPVQIAASRGASLDGAPTAGLRLIANDVTIAAGVRAAADRELARRGEISPEVARDRRRLDRAFGRMSSAGVVHAGRSSTFNVMTAEEAKRHVHASRPAPTRHSAHAADLDPWMGLAKPGPAVVHAGRTSTFRAGK
ncbi:MAG: hypothetical protein JST00_20045 [Deltaproteobacteria bacterium]|nr:hypothetical protein [Deltaproteobacteria bacterium]